MKPMPGLPCGVRLTEGLGGVGGAAALALAAETLAGPERRATLSTRVVITTGSVPELSPIRHRRCEPEWRCIRSRACARIEPNTTPALYAILALPTEVAVRCSSEFPMRSLAVNSEQVV